MQFVFDIFYPKAFDTRRGLKESHIPRVRRDSLFYVADRYRRLPILFCGCFEVAKYPLSAPVFFAQAFGNPGNYQNNIPEDRCIVIAERNLGEC